MQHRKRIGFGQHRIKRRPVFRLGAACGVVPNHQVQFKLLKDVVSSNKSEFAVEPTQGIVIVSYDSKTEFQYLSVRYALIARLAPSPVKSTG